MNARCDHCGTPGYEPLCPTCLDRARRRAPDRPLGHCSWKGLLCPYCGAGQSGVVGRVFRLADYHDPLVSRSVETDCSACARPFRAHLEHVPWLSSEPIGQSARDMP